MGLFSSSKSNASSSTSTVTTTEDNRVAGTDAANIEYNRAGGNLTLISDNEKTVNWLGLVAADSLKVLQSVVNQANHNYSSSSSFALDKTLEFARKGNDQSYSYAQLGLDRAYDTVGDRDTTGVQKLAPWLIVGVVAFAFVNGRK